MDAENTNNMKKSERRIFRYTLADAWGDTISQVEVLEGIEDKNVRCLYFDRRTGNTNVDFFCTTISQEDIEIIKQAMQSHIDIFQYKEIELPVVLDGVIHTFEFTLDENFTNTITAYNIGAFRKYANIGILGTHPYKGSTVLQLFDQIAKLLLEHGVDPKYVQIS